MFRLCIVALLLASPVLAMRPREAEVEMSADSETGVENMSALEIALAKGALGAELSDDDVVAHGGVLLSIFTNLNASKEEIASKFQVSPSLKQLVRDDLANGAAARTDAVRASLLERAKGTLGDEEVTGFEQALRRKDTTECVCFMLNYHSVRLVDLDGVGNYGFQCPSSCLNGCKRGAAKFKMDPMEAMELGAEGVQQSVVGAKCGWGGGCQCLDATQSVHQVRAARMSFGNFDPAYLQNAFITETECMNGCHCPDRNGINYEGLCLDEYYSN